MWRFSVLVIVFHFWTFGHAQEPTCGKIRSSTRLFGKIVGGYDVGFYKYPWFAALLLDGTAWCGGTLIGENVVVTAAHCYRPYILQTGTKLEDVFTVKLGIYQSCKSEKTQKEFKAKQVIVHELYMKKKPYYDIALIILQGDSNKFEPACLPPSVITDKNRGNEAYIIGLGTLNFSTDNYPCNLHEGRVLLYSDKTCKNMIRKTTDDKEDYPMTNAFCAGYVEGGVDACQGDSGGPIMVVEPGGRYVLIGLTSFGYECAEKDQMGLYTDVSKYLDWIYEKTGVRSRLISTPTTTTTTTQSPPYNDGDLQFNISDFLPTENRPPLVYQEAPNTIGQQQGQQGNPSYVQQINNPYQDIQQVMANNPPKRIIIEFKKRKRQNGHRRKLHRPYRRYYKDRENGKKQSKPTKKKALNEHQKH